MTNAYPRESDEFQAVTVTVDGTRVVDEVEVAVTIGAERPTSWAPALMLGGKPGLMTGGRSPGTYTVWARVTDAPEVPVVSCGRFIIT